MPPGEFEPTISARERPKTYALDRAATGTVTSADFMLRIFTKQIVVDICCTELHLNTRVGTLIVATIYLQLIQNRYMFRSFTVLQCSHQHCVQPVASNVEVVGYL